jgi:MoaA/NifB/PqqE/SkfB family radical SAM enzyme
VHLDFDLYGVKIYKFEIFKKYPYNLECLSCEVEQLDRLKKDGYEYQCPETIMGLHSPKWNDNEIFERYYNLMEKFKKFGYSWLETLPLKLWNKIKKQPSEQNLYAFLGAYTSMIRDDIRETEKDFTQSKFLEFGVIESHLNQPTSATIYVTSKCNFKCEWCYRQHGFIEEAPDFDISMTRQLMSKFPSIQGVCLCGYGETFLSPNLKYIIRTLRDYKVFVGLISNGSVLKQNLPNLLEHELYLPHYISISVNASNEEIHKNTTKTETFKQVLESIKFSLDHKIDTFASYVCTKDNIKYVPEFLKIMKGLGVKTVHLHNLLPHYKDEDNKFWDYVLQKDDLDKIELIKKLPEADIVKTFPILISKIDSRTNCMFPWRSIAVNGNGSISICNSVYPCDSKFGNIKDSKVWQNDQCISFRKKLLLGKNPACLKCFRNWE